MASNDHLKSILVSLEEVGSASRIRNFEIVIDSNENKDETDCSRVVNAIIKDYPDCKELLMNGELTFTIESLKFPGRYAEFNQKSSIEDGRCLRCFVVRGLESDKNKKQNFSSSKYF